MSSTQISPLLHGLRQLWMQPGVRDPTPQMIDRIRSTTATREDIEYLQLPGWSVFGDQLEMSMGQLIGISPGYVLYHPCIRQGLVSEFPNKNLLCLIRRDIEHGLTIFEGLKLSPLYTEVRFGDLLRRNDRFEKLPAIGYWQTGLGNAKQCGEMGFDGPRWVQVLEFFKTWLPVAG